MRALPSKPVPMDIEELDILFEEREVASIRKNLLHWYDKNQRTLPWRAPATVGEAEEDMEVRAYSVWVSEMMLQQTQVERVKDYYTKWMEKWPSLSALSQASLEEVNTMWAGLGYYRRARFLLEGARYIVEKCNGSFPRNVAELQQIPGIGRYTAGAVASIAFKQAVPAVDANVIRVLGRVRAISANLKESATTKLLWDLAGQIVDLRRPGSFNQALMDLGSAICTSRNPLCSNCPIADSCKAFALETASRRDEEVPVSVTDFPIKPVKTVRREEFTAVCVVEMVHSFEACTSFLLVQRPKNGLLAGLWEFPSVPLQHSNVSSKTRTSSINKYLKRSLGLKVDDGDVKVREAVGRYTHVFSHIRLHMHIEWLQILKEKVGKPRFQLRTQWVKDSEMETIGLTSGVRKTYKMVSEYRARKCPSPGGE